MSGTSDRTICPACDRDSLEVYSDWKPYEYVSGDCLECGFSYYTKSEDLTLSEVNSLREELELKPLKRLKKKEREL